MVAKSERADRRDEIAAITAQVVAEQGVEKVSMRSIAKAMGATTGTLVHYFDNKEELMEYCLGWINRRHRVDVELPPKQREDWLRLFLTPLPTDHESHQWWRVRLQFWAYVLTHPKLLENHKERLARRDRVALAMLSQAQQRGVIRPDVDLQRAIGQLSALAMGYSIRLMFCEEQRVEEAQQVIGEYLESLLV